MQKVRTDVANSSSFLESVCLWQRDMATSKWWLRKLDTDCQEAKWCWSQRRESG